jgi:hypothetical protein
MQSDQAASDAPASADDPNARRSNRLAKLPAPDTTAAQTKVSKKLAKRAHAAAPVATRVTSATASNTTMPPVPGQQPQMDVYEIAVQILHAGTEFWRTRCELLLISSPRNGRHERPGLQPIPDWISSGCLVAGDRQ